MAQNCTAEKGLRFHLFLLLLFKRLKYITSSNSEFTLSTRTTTKKSWLGCSRRQHNKEKKSYVTSVLWDIFLHYALSFIHVDFCLFNNSGALDQTEPYAFNEYCFSYWFICWVILGKKELLSPSNLLKLNLYFGKNNLFFIFHLIQKIES